ncbi:ComF family protein [Cupriavidus numazuensis]|uniref:ComF family protein n=1 Tax=Cupriavidus numazuensis TaxID=221992 RepID=UPI001BA6584E
MRALLPCSCALCGTVQDEVVCRDCVAELLYPVSRCPVCAMGRAPGEPCRACAQHRPDFDQAFTLGDYGIPQDSLVLALKYGKVLSLAGWLAAALASRVRAAGAPMPDLIAPIPLSPQRLAERGFNQAWEIARPLARHLGVASDPVLLERPRDIATQHLLDLAQRQMNVRGAFRMGRPRPLAGMHVGLVDDVMTTGATLDEAARTLKAQGAARVSVIVALRTP